MTESIVLGGGCFWCLEAAYQLVGGVTEVIPGYSGGDTENPTYEQVSKGNTGHAEVVKITFDPEIITLQDILNIFWIIHDPTTLNRQGADVGTQYRSIILFENPVQEDAIATSISEAAKLWDSPISTTVLQLRNFYEAEQYHHNYFVTHPDQAYCQVVINPKLAKLRQHFSQLLN